MIHLVERRRPNRDERVGFAHDGLDPPAAASSSTGTASSITFAASSVSGSQYERGTSNTSEQGLSLARGRTCSSSFGVAAVRCATTRIRAGRLTAIDPPSRGGQWHQRNPRTTDGENYRCRSAAAQAR
jgi:hypothetical protein